jgi:hypothetical protein
VPVRVLEGERAAGAVIDVDGILGSDDDPVFDDQRSQRRPLRPRVDGPQQPSVLAVHAV